MYEDLKGKVAVVTGGARGLGYQMAGALAALGAEVALLDLLPEVTDSAARLAGEKGVRTVGIAADVTDQTSIGNAVAAVAGSLGTPSILVNAAGITAWSDSLDVTAESWRKVIDVNLTGTFFSCQAFARSVLAGGGTGAIVNVSSMSAFVVNIPQNQVSYNASKAAVDQLTKSLAVEWISKGIRVNAIAPGYFLSDMTRQFLDTNAELGNYWKSLIPAGRMGQPADLDGLVCFLASDASQYIVGESIVIDGGYSIV
ncbi:NAD(P)-dependent dehydrogenase, short-chain alcohol dehydrogenase family [Nakamurella panacisegetis]|uniref:NAD(P)-dependent dehydrogenase, short-chain alcohol dehydrogenase family n=1 Tax=Nakamurella panacisegetis TaxID=1090615 RepID=A0A1H0T9G6_9ACTN|nr:SDR family oxidoreductase [Nakamurella panacisegetis]SDP50431.1 NAD(P)-dependent dehydrogenase, short-chain alcohol dehydrogenase family [Nakamurella panacisegetis]